MKKTILYPPVLWSKEKVFFDGGDYFDDLLKAIEGAKRHVDIETYIFEPGKLSDRVVKALIKAVRRGVKVRVLVDGIGSPDFADHYGAKLEKSGVSYKVYRSWPMVLSRPMPAFLRGHWHRGIRGVHLLLNRVKHRDHRKLYSVDRSRVWLGSFNISDWHIRAFRKDKTWRDTGIRLSGVKSLVFLEAFEIAWTDPWPRWHQSKYRRMLKGWAVHDVAENPVRLTLTRRLRVAYRQELLKRFQTARKRIWVTTPYFVPNQALLTALANAARRGCGVRIIIPGLSDVPVVRWVSMIFYSVLLRAGCRLYEYQKSGSSAKLVGKNPG
jgi:cardiolipin synthase